MSMIWIRLAVTECELIASAFGSSAIVYMKGRITDRRRLRTPAGRDMSEREWSIRLTSDQWTGSLGGIGVASHIPALDDREHGHDEFFSLELSTSPATLGEVIEMARGKPSYFSVSFETSGLRYGWEPDGSVVEWDCDREQNLVVTDATFKSSLIEPTAAPDVDPPAHLDALQMTSTALPSQPTSPLVADKALHLLRILIVIAGAGLLALVLK